MPLEWTIDPEPGTNIEKVDTFTITEDGTWTLVVEAGSTIFSDTNLGMSYSPTLSVSYTIGDSSSISDIESNDHISVPVYNVLGMKLMQSATSSDLNSLPAGIYIHNGKKVHVK